MFSTNLLNQIHSLTEEHKIMVWVRGQQLKRGKYVVDMVLGQNAFYITYLAKTRNDRAVVIKTINKKIFNSDVLESNFSNEAVLIANCKHPHIVKVEEIFIEGSLSCMVMEYIEGVTLSKQVEINGILLENDALKYIYQIGEALSVVHSNGLLHRNVTPHNILIRSGKSEAVLIDFGIAENFIDDETSDNTRFVSDGFSPKEQYYRDAKESAYTDVYGLAATLYFLLTGKIPPPAIDRQYYGEQLIPAKEINRQISDRLNDAIIKGMALEPEDRPQSIREWLDLLKVEDADIDSQIEIEIKPLEYQIIDQIASVPQAIIWQAEQKLYGNRYTIIKAQQDRTELGSGGFGITYLARNDRGREVVIKTLNERAQTSPKFAKIQQDFRDEATRLGYCKHPHIVQIENKFDVGQLPCIVLEYIKGETLWERVANHGALSEAEALLYIRQIGEALIVVHSKGLLHRDVNPSNIIVRADHSEAVLIDFGISKEYIPDLTQQYTIEYTPCFAPLEQHDQNGKHGNYTDVYALAATMFYLVTGNRPTPAANRVINDEFIPQNLDNTKISDKVKNAILNGMALDPKKRSQSVDEWLKVLEGSENKNRKVARLRTTKAILVFSSIIATIIGIVAASIERIPGFIPTLKQTNIEPFSTPLESIQTTFRCIQQQKSWAILAQRGNAVSTLPLITFNSTQFGSDWTPKERCYTVSQRLTEAVANNGGRFDGLTITTAKVNGYTVVCSLAPNETSCNRQNMLFTLNQKNGEDPNLVLLRITNFVNGRGYNSTVPNN